MNANTRLVTGISMLVIGLMLPFGIYPLSMTAWPAAVKTVVGGVLFFGFELMAIPAVAIMGKDKLADRAHARQSHQKGAGYV